MFSADFDTVRHDSQMTYGHMAYGARGRLHVVLFGPSSLTWDALTIRRSSFLTGQQKRGVAEVDKMSKHYPLLPPSPKASPFYSPIVELLQWFDFFFVV